MGKRKTAATANYISAEHMHQHETRHHSTAHPTGAHEAAQGYMDTVCDDAMGNVGKSGTASVEDNHGAVVGTGRDSRASATPGDPGSPAVGAPYSPQNYQSMRLSEPLTAGHASSATGGGDHNLGAGRNPDLAVGISGRNINQSSTNPVTWQSMRTANQDRPDADIIYAPGRVNVQLLDLSGASNAPQFRDPVTGNPAVRGMDHIARDSATPANPVVSGLGQIASASRSPMSAKADTNTSRLDMMREFVHQSLQRRD